MAMTRFPYKVNTKHLNPAVCAWCNEHVGKFDHDWFRFGTDIAAALFDPDATETYYFAQEKHAMWFRLRWA
jgi:hypothetical protein